MATLSASDLKGGKTFIYEGKPFRGVKYAHQKVGRGGATVKISARNLENGSLEHMTFNSTAKFESIETTKRPLQYLYKDSINAVFMNERTFEQVEIPLEILGSDINFIKEGDTANILFWDDKPLSVELPPKVIMTIKETDPGVKGNSASNMYKSATLDNNVAVKVPLFIKIGDKVRVDTRTGDYVERVS
ncbi:elongation factor P [Candidatus Woesebacteria bacterium RIFOXYB1_FULL_38_16]|uniref:Elongation factor P n=1 Tax=Candidatus Woesebacteria bacterium RIFOXYB1_FULL_38_16 TaxID=1802538 RepID=A0A1F8CVA8_9BACT|nr:MAG: elongation factor P [Candidatus Woesebacteria bacterium RIFOXYA1_FULL_38_9]OGM80260.1 MAG: elongation factor P [Candidatus Woesebacteria bacterium RIFOXYB1_FULL_38_16]